eukprot:1156723-Pelagomonas_calceolata.AAC.1
MAGSATLPSTSDTLRSAMEHTWASRGYGRNTKGPLGADDSRLVQVGVEEERGGGWGALKAAAPAAWEGACAVAAAVFVVGLASGSMLGVTPSSGVPGAAVSTGYRLPTPGAAAAAPAAPAAYGEVHGACIQSHQGGSLALNPS